MYFSKLLLTIQYLHLPGARRFWDRFGCFIGYEDLVLSVVYDMTQMAITSLEMTAETYFFLQKNVPNNCNFQLMENIL